MPDKFDVIKSIHITQSEGLSVISIKYPLDVELADYNGDLAKERKQNMACISMLGACTVESTCHPSSITKRMGCFSS
jgi:hypothetical protein